MGRKMVLHARDLVEFCHTLQTGNNYLFLFYFTVSESDGAAWNVK